MPTNREEVRDDDLGKATNGRYSCTDGGTKLGPRDRDDSGAFVETYPDSEFTDALDDLGGSGSTRDRNRRYVKRSIGFV